MEIPALYLCLFRRVNYLSRIRKETRSPLSGSSNRLILQNLHAAERITPELLWTISCPNCELSALSALRSRQD